MATLATIFDRFVPARSLEQAAPRGYTRENDNPYIIRAIANEDVYFFHKKIDNTHVVRQADPRARGVCWKLIGSSFLGAVVLIGLLLPGVYGLLEGYRIEELRAERQRLQVESSGLDLQEARLLNPARLEKLAEDQQFVDPAPQKVFYLEPKEGTLARR